MRNNFAPLFVGIDLVPSKGGPFKSLGFFNKALGGRVLSFTHPDDINGASGDVTHVQSLGGRAGRMFLPVPPGQLAKADAMLAAVDLLSCHILYRHSAHWVHSQARRRRIPYWVVPHGCLDPYVFTYRAGVKRAWMHLFGRRILADAAHVIFSTRRELEKASAWLSGSNARVVHWPVEAMPCRTEGSQRRIVRERHGIPEKSRAVLFLARLHPMKRPMETLRSFAAGGNGLHLVMAGPEDGVSCSEVLAEAERLGVEGRVTVLPPLYGSAKMELLSAVDGFVSLSIRENFNHAAAEAMSAGLPVLLSRGNDLGPEIAKRDCGWVLDCDERPDWEAGWAAAAAATEAELLGKGAQGRKFAQGELSFERFAGRLSELHAEAVAR